MTTLQTVELGVLGPLQVRQYGLPVSIPGAKPRAILTMLGLHGGSVVSAETLVELLWGDAPPRTAAKALQTHISALRRTLGDGFVLTEGTGWTLRTTEIDATRYKLAAKMGRDAIAAGDASQAVARFDEALTLWRGIPELPDGPRGVSEKTRWIESHAAVVEDRADALLATGRAAEIIGELEAAIADAPLRERRWGQLMLALYRAGRQGEALGAYQRARSLLADELGVDPGPDLRRLEAAIVAQDSALEMPVSQQLSAVTRAVTFLLTDIEGSTAAWEADANAMAAALARHDEIVEQVVTSRGGRLIKTRGEGDATFSVFDRPSAAAAASIDLQEAIAHEPWVLAEPMRIRVALHTGEVEFRDGDYFGRAVNRAARLRSLAAGGQILCSGATAELVIDSLSDDVVLVDLGTRQLKNLARPEHVFELRLETVDDSVAPTTDTPMERPGLPAVLAGPGPFVGRGPELERLLSAWQTMLAAGTHAVLIAGEPGVGKTRLAGEWSRQAYELGAVVLYGRCDEDLGAPYQPFAEALRSLVPCLGTDRLRALRGVEALLPLVPGLTDASPDLAAPARADAGTERYALFDAVVALLGVASASAPVVLILDDLQWAAKPTLLLLRHLLRFGEHARVQIIGTYRSTDLDRSHPLAAMLADLHRDGSAHRLALSGLDEDDVTAYVAEAGYDDEELARALASVTGGNPFFLIEALRHVDESGGRWDPSTLPQGVREAVSRRLSRLPAETNKALAAAAVVGSRFALDLVERVVDGDLVDAFDEACKAGIVIEEPGGRYRFNHALVRQSLLAELASVRRMRLHQRIATTLETEPGADDELLAELAYHYFECAWAGNAGKAVEYCRRAADQAMARLAYEGAADLYDKALHALEELDDELPDREDLQAELLVARCEALLAAGDVVSAAGAVAQLRDAARDSARLTAWGTCFDGQLSMLTHPERLDQIESAVAAAAEKLAELEDAAGEAKAHTVRAACLARLGRIGDAETALDQALTAARRAREHRRVNAVLANAPLAALWGPNPVPRAGGRCLDVVRLLRITTGSPVVEATSTRCQGVLDAFRGRAAAGRALIDSARRTLTELGMRHALLEVDQFAGIVEMVADDPASAEPHLRRAYNGFRRMGLDADTAETAALLARTCLALDRDTEADELCTESERLAGHALKPSIAWRTVRSELLARSGAYDEARRVAEDAIAVAERTDLLVDHGDACLALATVLKAAGNAAGARAAAEQAVGLYELKGAAALAETARRLLGGSDVPATPAPAEPPIVESDTACVRAGKRALDAIAREAWDEYEQLFAPEVFVESRRKIGRFSQIDVQTGDWPAEARRNAETGGMRPTQVVIAVRGERLALGRLELDTEDTSPGAPHDELLQLFGIDEQGRIALQVWFDIDDMDAAIAELDAAHARLEEMSPRTRRVENAASQVDQRFWTYFPARDWDAMAEILTDDFSLDDRRQVLNAGNRQGRDSEIENLKVMADVGGINITSNAIATRGERLALRRLRFSGQDQGPEAFYNEMVGVVEIDADNQLSAHVVFDPDDIDAAFEELDTRYLAGEAAPYARVWQSALDTLGEANRHQPGPIIRGLTYVDHRRVSFGSADFGRAVEELWALVPDAHYRVTAVHALDAHGTVASLVIEGTDSNGNELQWSRIVSLVPNEPRMDVYEEDDVDAALARFEELRPRPRRLENTASQVAERLLERFAAHDWDAIAEILADDFSGEDRRPVVGAGIRYGRDVEIASIRAGADLGGTNMMSPVIATRGARLILTRTRHSGRDQSPEAFRIDVLAVVEIDADERIIARVVFDPDDIDAAFEELDARYVAGEAAAHADMWSVITQAHAAFRRHELPTTTPDWVNLDHRRGAAFAPGEAIAYVRAGWDLDQVITTYIEEVHRLNELGAVYTWAGHGTSQGGFDAEWRGVNILTVEGGLISRTELFDEANIDAAIAKFDEVICPAPRLENAASQVYDRLNQYFAARDWAAMAETIDDDMIDDDRRRVTNAGVRRGRDAAIAEARAVADMGAKNVALTVLATRRGRLALLRTRFSGGDPRIEAFHIETLCVVEVDRDDRMAAHIMFDQDDIDAAFAELDARYLAGEAAAHAPTWSVVTGALAAVNRHELPELTPDWVNIDHRRAIAFAPGDMTAYVHATWDHGPDGRAYIEAVHRLSNLGAIVTQVGHEISPQGFEAEWRMLNLVTVDGDSINRCELFDEADIDAALARFDELSRPTRRPENAATRVCERFRASFAARDWEAMAEVVADDLYNEDRRRAVNAGIRQGRESMLADMRVGADIGVTYLTAVDIATRGERLVLVRGDARTDLRPGAFHTDVLQIAEIDADERIAALVMFDPDDIDAAFQELDARYLAGEAAAHAHTWSVIAQAHDAFNRRELPTKSPELVDHRPLVTIEAGDPTANVREMWDFTPDLELYIEAVHRLSDLGAAFTQVSHGTSQEGFDAEWRIVELVTVDGDVVNRCELFDEADLDAALARFDELSRPAHQLNNAANQVLVRYLSHFPTRDWDVMAQALADDFTADDRRHGVNRGVQHGRDSEIANVKATAEIGCTEMTTTPIAIRGERLVLSSHSFIAPDWPGLDIEIIDVVEINTQNQIVAAIAFDADDIDAAFEELDARYLAGEAAAHAHTWSVVAESYAAFNRRELHATAPGWVNIDHRRGAAFAPGDMIAYIQAAWDDSPDTKICIAAVHRLSNLGAVVTHVAHGISQEGFDAEWRDIHVLTVEGDMLSRSELFDEADLDTALARFDELSRPAPRLENAASQTYERYRTYFAARDWAAMAQLLTADTSVDDHRRVVNAETRRGRDAEIANMRAVADIGTQRITSTVIATRGERLAICRSCMFGEDQQPGAYRIEFLSVVEINADEQIMARVAFDPDDIKGAVQELDRRYLSGDAADHSHIWSVIAQAYAAMNRHELPATTPDWETVDHRKGIAFAPHHLTAIIRSGWDVAPDTTEYIEAVHRLSDVGAVITHAAYGTSPKGFDAEWRMIVLLTVDGEPINRSELFDEADLGTALARFDELQPQTRRLENAASRVDERFNACLAARDWVAMAEQMSDDVSIDDRRRVVNAGIRLGRDAEIANLRAFVGLGVKNVTTTVIATRGEHLLLSRNRFVGRNRCPDAFSNEALCVLEINANERIVARVSFDPDDIDAAFEELEARYIAGEAAADSNTWSLITRTFAVLNRHELPPTAPDWAHIDHRPLAMYEASDLPEYLRATWDLTPQTTTYIEAVHRLSNLGAVVTNASHGTSREGFYVEWREISLLTFEGDAVSRGEVFDETDIDAALARFGELSRPMRRLENAAMRAYERFQAYFLARDWRAISETLAADHYSDDRRRVVNSGIRHGRDAEVASIKTTADLGVTSLTSVGIAVRGNRLALCRTRGATSGPDAFNTELLRIVEIDADERITRRVVFDLDDIDAAFEELDARYLAGEAAAHSHTWSVVVLANAKLNRRELPATMPDYVSIDHRLGTAFAPGDLNSYIRAAWDVSPNLRNHIEAVHRLSDFGAVFTHAAWGTSHEGFDAEWRVVELLTIEGELISRCELFDETDLDAALARFDELSRPMPQLENAATRTWARLADAFNRRDLDGFLALTSADGRQVDRRKGLRAIFEGPARQKAVHALFEAPPSSWHMDVEPIAIRGSLLSLTRERYRDTDDSNRPIVVELLSVLEVGDDGLVHDSVDFDPDDIDAAFEELDARYLAGEAAAHAHTWSVIASGYTAFNRRELPPMTPDLVNIDHRRGGSAFAAGEFIPYIHATWDVARDQGAYAEAVHRLSNLGAVVTQAVKGTSQEGFEAEWREIVVLTVDGDLLDRIEIFDEDDIDAALARVDELNQLAPRLENAAVRLRARAADTYNRRDVEGFLALAGGRYEDRRKGLRDEGAGDRKFAHAVLSETPTSWRLEIEPVAIRGDRLALTRETFRDSDEVNRPITVELITLTEVADDGLASYTIFFDPDDLNGAIAELTARWIASREVAHPEIIERELRLIEAANRHEWDAFAEISAGATYVNHRQLSADGVHTIAAHMSSIQTMASLVPDMRMELAEVLGHSASVVLTQLIVKGTSTDGVVMELPLFVIDVHDGEHVTHMETFDIDQRDLALARFQELNG